MKKKYLKYYFVVALFVLLISCRVPSKDMESTSFLEWSGLFLTKLNDIDLINSSFKEKKNFLDEQIFSKKQLLGFFKDNSINLKTKEELTSNFIQTLDNNSIILKRPLYITKKFGRLYGSSDAKEWFYIKPSNRKEIFEINYKFETVLDENKENLDVILTAAIDIKDELLTKEDIKIEKPIVKLDPTVFSFKKGKKKEKPNLYKNIIYIPENTIVSGEINLTGNVVEAKREENSIKLTALRDIYLYNNKKSFNLSFDRDKWDFSFYRVNTEKELDVTSIDDQVKYNLNILLTYKDKN